MAGGISIGLMQGAGSANPTMDAFGARTNQINTQRNQEAQQQQADQRFQMEQQRFDLDKQKQSDSDMLKVFEFAGAGYGDEARFLAKQKGLNVPEEIFSNADFAQGLSLAGKIYGDDKVAAQKFTQAWMSSPGGDMNTRIAVAQQAAGGATNPEDRTLTRQIALEKWKLNNKVGGSDNGFTLTPGQRRYDASGKVVAEAPAEMDSNKVKYVQDVVSSAMGGFNPVDPNLAKQAAEQYDQLFSGGVQQPGGVSIPPVQNSGGSPEKGIYAVQQLRMKGYNPQQIVDGLIQRGATPEQAKSILDAAGINK